MKCFLCKENDAFIDFNTILPVISETGQKTLINISDVPICENCFITTGGDKTIGLAILSKKFETEDYSGLTRIKPDAFSNLLFGEL